MEKVKIKAVGNYAGHSVKNNKSVDISFKFKYDELTNTVKLLQLLNENITVNAKVGDGKPFKLGLFMLKGLNVDHDGESSLKLNSQIDYVEADNINKLISDDELVQVLFAAEVDVKSEDDDEG